MLQKAVCRASPVYSWVVGAERVRVETFTDLRVDRFGRLLRAVREHGGEGCGRGRP
ncbi:predicted protein [Streptomyces viridosporus ATCC 14672]|uniref:Predicted protein n=1 Tax=Streptomyces viridosporus (strain ATCC 14672 / DSM 40746 / JCM 4963 / KCTC 9882 / NRRL B-12104 / FH 1290) TaxID=566461 RepID=D6A6W8_STRV1|nr:predicted protein [Streptomyces viridosporus ATCC 14672]